MAFCIIMLEVPFEVVEQIVTALPSDTKIQCLFVSKRWHAGYWPTPILLPCGDNQAEKTTGAIYACYH
ncbi:hypothetical protein BD408DRAFT_414242 [Parasitella parasitica]|nr:hypothetical protein BD408DRAFT_414242 [Parasitella parasitica]